MCLLKGAGLACENLALPLFYCRSPLNLMVMFCGVVCVVVVVIAVVVVVGWWWWWWW